MAFTNDDYLPSTAELTVPDIKLSSVVLIAGAQLYGKFCDNANKEYMLCMQEEGHPIKCISEGKQVTSCAFEFYGKVKKNCHEDFTKYWKCLDSSANNKSTFNFSRCRKLQSSFDNCAKEKIGVERPPLNYFINVKKHETSRTKPKKPLELPYPEPLPTSPDAATTPSPEGLRPYGRSGQ